MNLLALAIICHLVGDFLLQNDGMQTKSKDSLTCTAHVAMYSLPFIILVVSCHLSLVQFFLIMIQHWLQDRFSLHLKWMQFYGHTPPDRWPVGPLCIDQSFHLLFIAIVLSL